MTKLRVMNVSVSDKMTYALVTKLKVLLFTVSGGVEKQVGRKLHVSTKIILLLQSAFSLYFPCTLTAFLVRVLSVSFKLLTSRSTQSPVIFKSACELLAL